MKPTTINVQITKCPKQYEAVRLGMEASLEQGESVESAIYAATSQLNTIYAQMYTDVVKATPAQDLAAPAQNKADKAKDERELLTVGDKRVQQIVNRLEKNPGQKAEILANVQKYYRVDEQVAKVLGIANALI